MSLSHTQSHEDAVRYFIQYVPKARQQLKLFVMEITLQVIQTIITTDSCNWADYSREFVAAETNLKA